MIYVVRQNESDTVLRRVPFVTVASDGTSLLNDPANLSVLVTLQGRTLQTSGGTRVNIGSAWQYYQLSAGEVGTAGFVGVGVFGTAIAQQNIPVWVRPMLIEDVPGSVYMIDPAAYVGTTPGRSIVWAIGKLVNKVALDQPTTGTMTIYTWNDTGTLFQQALTTSTAGTGVTAVDTI